MAAQGYGPDELYAHAQNGWDRNPLNSFYGGLDDKFLRRLNPHLLSSTPHPQGAGCRARCGRAVPRALILCSTRILRSCRTSSKVVRLGYIP